MARRSVNSKRHKAVCKNDRHAPDVGDDDDADDDSEQVKPGTYGVHGDTIPQFVHDTLEASDHLGDWLQAIDWYAGEASGATADALGPYGLAPQSLRVPAGTDQHLFKAFCIPMALVEMDCEELALKLHWMMFVMLFCPVYEVGLSAKPLSPTAAVKVRVERFLAGEWRSLWEDALAMATQQQGRKVTIQSDEEEEAVRLL